LTEVELRAQLLRRLNRVAERLPNGLLHRLVDDAQFFCDWNLRKKRARASARLAQYHSWQDKAEDKRWRSLRSQRPQ
jgi:hypothetical protein